MGYVNVIWQGDMNRMVLQLLPQCSSPAGIYNITGTETLSVRDVALQFGKLFGKTPKFVDEEAPTALLNNAGLVEGLLGRREVSPEQMIRWIANWIINDHKILNKFTHFEVRDGKY